MTAELRKTVYLPPFVLALFCMASFSALQAVPAPGSATPIEAGHPRLMFKTGLWQDGLSPEDLAVRAGQPPYKAWFDRLSPEEYHTAALSWLLRSSGGRWSQSDSIAENTLARMLALPRREGNFYNGENLHRLSLAYDWLYNYPGFTPEKKKALREKMLFMAETLVSKAVPGLELVYGEEIFHNYCSNAALAIGLTGLALYEGPQDREANRLIRIAEQWYFQRAFPALALLEGGWHEGMAYSLNHVIQESPIWVAAYRSATGIDWFGKIRREQGGWMEGWIYFCLANLQPDYTFVRSGDNGATRMIPDRNLRQALEIVVSAYCNPHGKFLIDELQERLGDAAISSGDLWMPLIFYADSSPSTDYRGLPASQFINPGRLGFVTLRSGWGPDETFVHFECGDYFGSHNHLDQNQFTIYHKGSLAIDSGYYDGYGAHREKYACRAIAHNTILVRDPLEIVHSHYVGDYPSPGGQRNLDYYFNNSNYQLSVYWDQYRDKAYADMADIVAWETGPEYDYVAGDATAAYNSTVVTDPGARPKISRFLRRLLFVKPDLVAICDNVTAVDSTFEKSWLLHTINQPQIQSDRSVLVIDKGGQMVLSPILPEDFRIEVIGGPGKEFMVNGENQPLETRRPLPPAAEPGAWRIELKPGAPRKQDIFLNLIQVGDAGSTPVEKFRLAGNAELTGVVSDSLALLFTRDRGKNAALPGIFTLPAAVKPGSRVILAGLEKNGIYRLNAGGKVVTTVSAGKGGVVELNLAKDISGEIRLVAVGGKSD